MTATTNAPVEATPCPIIFVLGPPGVGKTTLGSPKG
jgi:ATP-dependent Lon protease